MAGYNRDIVATRKLNKKNKARLGRKGDTKIREVEGRDSHVNALEAYLIDVNGRVGEDYAKRVGAGTTNPLTGMPEYHTEESQQHRHTDENDPNSSYILPAPTPKGYEIRYVAEDKGITGRQSYETLFRMDEGMLESYLQGEFGMADDSMQYIEGFQEKPFEFLKEQQKLTTDRAGVTKGFEERGLQSTYGATMGALGSQEKTLGIQAEGLTAQQAALGRTTGRGFSQATGAAGMAASRSGLATSGTITQGYETQKKQLFQDFTAGAQDIGRQRAGINIAMGDIGRQKGTALETLQLGKEGADLDFRQAEYLEKKRQLDQLYDDVAAVPS